mmetsp:Transcript_18101/g.56180  ORF Transcript_18101/g.56180 Transcript_18101/m.56180 type:complete len:263 (-) Transcript_18101:341-1129(-)
MVERIVMMGDAGPALSLPAGRAVGEEKSGGGGEAFAEPNRADGPPFMVGTERRWQDAVEGAAACSRQPHLSAWGCMCMRGGEFFFHTIAAPTNAQLGVLRAEAAHLLQKAEVGIGSGVSLLHDLQRLRTRNAALLHHVRHRNRRRPAAALLAEQRHAPPRRRLRVDEGDGGRDVIGKALARVVGERQVQRRRAGRHGVGGDGAFLRHAQVRADALGGALGRVVRVAESAQVQNVVHSGHEARGGRAWGSGYAFDCLRHDRTR